MVNKKGGKKHKRGKNNNQRSQPFREKEIGQEIAQIKKCNGNCRFEVMCFDGTERKAVLCGTMRKRRFVNSGDIVLVSLRDFQDSICDIIDVYEESNARKLKDMGLVPDFITFGDDDEFNTEEDLGIDITEVNSEEDTIDIDEI